MTRLSERHSVRCPESAARENLNRMLQQASQNELLRLAVPVPAVSGGLAKDVRVSYARLPGAPAEGESWLVHWTPEPGGIYPSFEGTIAVRADGAPGDSVLVLEGRYTPPAGAIGQIFDSVIGARIASATLQALLSRIAEKLEQCYERRYESP